MTTTNTRCSCCRWLYSLYGECLVIVCTLLHVFMTTAEILIHLEIINVPGKTPVDGTEVTVTTPSDSNVTTSLDPGGCKEEEMHDNLAIKVMQYGTLALSVAFVIESICRLSFSMLDFFRDCWQVTDLVIVLCSLAAEVTLYVLHEKPVCIKAATEAAQFVVILRLWRIPRTCNIRRQQYRNKIENEIKYWRQFKTDSESQLKKVMADSERQVGQLETMYRSQVMELQQLRTVLKQNSFVAEDHSETVLDETKHIANGFAKPLANGDVTDGVANTHAVTILLEETKYAKAPSSSDLERNDSDSKNSKKNSLNETDKVTSTMVKPPRQKLGGKVPSVIVQEDEAFDSDGSEIPADAVVSVQEVEVQIEAMSRQNRLSSESITKEIADAVAVRSVELRRKSSFEGTFFVNRGYATEEDDVADLDGTRTYRSADGIPMTDL
ncbi:uncharacterized protein LOC127878942 [Dreissena polymorpha]|uniref:Voltage-gated hydrogen channel 1 n=1 Tax=Dreissena polymorpha TaxID=45954 RepID=A0A9D4QRY9_DREPO|nr:uncharacterized protein LOC127878942 [Dreissena polymorpha]KAH3840105.1 hypothetical protein DPMN_113548 [Dreissena polymorpha]